jgi:hypothetical protein
MISVVRKASLTTLDAAAQCLLQIRLIARKPAQAGVGIEDGRGNRLIHLMRQRRSQR